MSKSSGTSCWPPDGCGSQIGGNGGWEWPVAGGSSGPTLSPGSALAGSTLLSALSSGTATSLAVAPTTILGHFMGPTWSQWEET